MDTVEIVIITISIILLIFLLYTFNYMMVEADKTMEWPPKEDMNNCPDFWVEQKDDNDDLIPGLCKDETTILNTECSSIKMSTGSSGGVLTNYDKGYTFGYLTTDQDGGRTELAVDNLNHDASYSDIVSTDSGTITAQYAYFNPNANISDKKKWSKWIKKCGASWQGIDNIVDNSVYDN